MSSSLPIGHRGASGSTAVASATDDAPSRSTSWTSRHVTTVSHAITVDNTLPSVKYGQAPKNNAKLTKKFKITANATDRFGIARVQLLVNGKVVAIDTQAAYSFTVNPKNYGKKFTVQLRAYDKAGNIQHTAKRTYRR